MILFNFIMENPLTISAFRPICLLDGCGKLLEKFIVSRLTDHFVNNRAIADNQYDFRFGRSTLGLLGLSKAFVQVAMAGYVFYHRLVGMLILDVCNSFDSAPWG